jgi:rod shape-determining protein MreC
LAAVALMTLDHRAQLGQGVRETLSAAVYPVHFVANLPFEAADFLSEELAGRRELIEDNARLKAQQLLYDARLQRLAALERENIELRDLLKSSYEISEPVLIAELMRVDLDPYTHLIQIDKGSNSGLFVGQPVLDAQGVMGQIDQIGPFSAIVRLITDPGHAIPVQINRTGVRAIALGTGDTQRLELSSLPNNVDVQVGDLLVTSGLGGRFPQGYPVARVTRVTQDPGAPFARISAEPKAELGRSRQVLLVKTHATRNAEPAEPQAEEPQS